MAAFTIRNRRIISCLMKCGLILGVIVLIITMFVNKNDVELPFESFNNVSGSPFKIVPNTVHFVIFGSSRLSFISFLSLVSAIKVQESNIWIHCDCHEMTGYYWSLIMSLSTQTNVPVKLTYMRRPTHVYGQLLSSVYHASDIARIQVLMENGGIYLDTDMVLLKPLDQFLHFEMTVGWPYTEYCGNQIMIGHPKARFLKMYLESYRRYLPTEWYYNGGQVPTEQILKPQPHLVHRVPIFFGVHNLVDELYGTNKWPDWRHYYSIHLLSRHHSHPEQLNETTILDYDRPFGDIARSVLYHMAPSLDPTKGTWNE